MKYFPFFLLTAAVWAQSAAPPAAPPAPAPGAGSQAQSPNMVTSTFDVGKAMAKTVSPGTVVATFEDGRKLTAGELDSFLAAMPPNMAQAARRDRRAFVQQFAMMHRLSEL